MPDNSDALANASLAAHPSRHDRHERDEFACPCCGVGTDSSYCAACQESDCGEQHRAASEVCLVGMSRQQRADVIALSHTAGIAIEDADAAKTEAKKYFPFTAAEVLATSRELCDAMAARAVAAESRIAELKACATEAKTGKTDLERALAASVLVQMVLVGGAS